MKDEEKNLIENLFHRLKNAELNAAEKDKSADDLIQKLVKNQPTSSYYMTQTILIQETAIKKLSIELEELRKKINTPHSEKIEKKSSFLSNFFKLDPASQMKKNDNHTWKNNESPAHPSGPPVSTPITAVRNSGFLSNALQTATGVAGGMILGNMLMNVFNHSKPEEEIFDTIKEPSEHLLEEDLMNNSHHNNLVDYDHKDSDTFQNSHSEYYSEDENTEDYTSSLDVDDDNFV